MELETMLADLFEDRWPADRNPYELSKALQLKPWVYPPTDLWRTYKSGEPARNQWDADAIALLIRLHDDYQMSKGEA